MTPRVSMLLKWRASPDMLPFSLCNKKRLATPAHVQTPLSYDTIDSALRHRKVGRAKDLSAPPRIYDRKGKSASYSQIRPVAQSCSGIIKGQSEVLKLLAHSFVN